MKRGNEVLSRRGGEMETEVCSAIDGCLDSGNLQRCARTHGRAGAKIDGSI